MLSLLNSTSPASAGSDPVSIAANSLPAAGLLVIDTPSVATPSLFTAVLAAEAPAPQVETGGQAGDTTTPVEFSGEAGIAPELDAAQWLQQALDQQQLAVQVRDISPLQAAEGTVAPTLVLIPAVQVSQLQTRQMETAPAPKPDGASQPPNALVPEVASMSASSLATELHASVIGPVADPKAASESSLMDLPLAKGEALTSERASSFASPANLSGISGLASVDKPQLEVGVAVSKSPELLKTTPPEAKWGEQLLHTLRDQVQVQIQQRIQQATIRLDPPELGSLEIFLSHEAGRISVQINASQADVARLLQQTSDRLRQELAGGQFTQVDVTTTSDTQSGQQRSHQRQQAWTGEDAVIANGQLNPAGVAESDTYGRRRAGTSPVKTAGDLLIKV